jgi:hypothetical protein
MPSSSNKTKILVILAVCLTAAATIAASAGASVSGQTGAFGVSDPWVYCSWQSYAGSPSGSPISYGGFAESLTVNPPTVYGMYGYAAQQVGWQIRVYRVLGDGTLQYVSRSTGEVAWATPTVPAAFHPIRWTGANLFGTGGNFKIVLDLYWFDAYGKQLGTFWNVYSNYYENINGANYTLPYCVL